MKTLKLLFVLELILSQNLIAQKIEYLFHLQTNNFPHFIAPLNLKKINSIIEENRRKILKIADKTIVDLEKKISPNEKILFLNANGNIEYYDFTLLNSKNWNTISQYLGINNEYIFSALNAFYKINKLPNLKRYLETCLKNGISFPNFYTSRTPFIKKEDLFLNTNDKFSFVFWPCTLIDKEALNNVINIFKTQKSFKLVKLLNFFRPKNLITLPIVTTNSNINKANNTPKRWDYVKKYDASKNKYLDLAVKSNIIFGIKNKKILWHTISKNLNKPIFAKTQNLSPYFFSPYGIFNLALLKFGLGTDGKKTKVNKNIQDIENKIMYISKVIEDVNLLFSNNKNPWNNQYFKREDFLQLEIVKIFDENPELFKLIKQGIDFDNQIKPFESYKKILNQLENNKELYGKNATEFDIERIKPFLPNEKLTLAYLLTTMIGLIHQQAWNRKNLIFSTEKWIQNATIQKFNSQSFLDIWEKIIKKLPPKNNWISMDLQPSVFSFDKTLLNTQIIYALQDKKTKVNISILKKLGCTIISSTVSTTQPSFIKIKKSPKSNKKQNK